MMLICSRRYLVAALVIPLCLVTVGNSQPQYQIYGINFSPLLHGQGPGVQISAGQIQARLAIVAPYTKWVRTYSSLNGLEQVCPIAHQMGLKCAAGASIYGVPTDAQEIASLITLAQKGYADLAIVGTEALFRRNISASGLVNYMNQVKAAAPGVQVTTADTYAAWFDNPVVLTTADVVLVNIYPFYEAVPLPQSVSWVNGWYQLLTQEAGSKRVVISETGWPTGGVNVGAAAASPANGSYYFLSFVSWARANNVSYFYFEAFDEAWKSSENSQGPHFGVWDENGTLKPGMGSVFSGATIADNWTGNPVPGGSGTPSLMLTYVPPFGSLEKLSGQVLHLRPADHKIACYLYVPFAWYVKPFYSRPLTPILSDGTWSCSPGETGETKLAAFVVPNGYNPPGQVFGEVPSALLQSSEASAIVTLLHYAISGVVQDSAGNGIDGVQVLLSGSRVEATQTAQGGKFSFVDLAAGENYVVTPAPTGSTFTPVRQAYANLTGPQTANFTINLAPPFGRIDTPVNGSTGQAGAINFTGWALSPITIANVALCRDVIPGESGINGLVYLGNAVLVPGVRPDVAATFPGYANNNWGWGAQILTNYLPGTNGSPLGNGTYRLHAVASDRRAPFSIQDSSDCSCPQPFCTDLGATTIGVNNAASVVPFGTIDTPGQGDTISGTDYVNFGWVVTSQPNIVPTDGSTITVHIDGFAVGHPTYNQFRSDIATLFPGLKNSAGAVGIFHIDTTKLSNGIHNIDWVAVDSAGHSGGIGSRNFFVQN